MHTFNGESCTIHYNSDMSGEVIINSKTINKAIEIEAKDILDFVADYIRREKISTFENMSTTEILHS